MKRLAKSRLARSLAMIVLAIGMLLAMAVPAGASLNGDYGADGVRIRTGPSTSRTVVGLGYPGQGATLFCITTGTNINGDPFWLRNRNKATSVTGYSADYYMRWSHGSLATC
jgi:uncharacterized protein YraI